MESASPHQRNTSSSWPLTVILTVLVAAAAVIVYQLDSFDPASLPLHELAWTPLTAPLRNERMLRGLEMVGSGLLKAPEDVVYDSELGVVYTGCEDGWVMRVTVNESAADSVVEDLVNTGGRPLGLAIGKNEIIVADAYKGLLSITGNSTLLLTDEADGRKFKLTDAVDIAEDGIIYFTDASYKYNMKDFLFDVLEGKPHGRFMSFDPKTKTTRVLVSDIYFANGVAVSPDQTYVVFCESIMRRCKKYYIKGEKSGRVDKFIDDLPGLPDNIHYDGQGLYWIAINTEITKVWDLAFRYPFIRKIIAIVERHVEMPKKLKNSGVMAVDLEGKPVAHYYDPELTLITSAIKIGDHLYCGSLSKPNILRLNLRKYPALATTSG
ncbi:hypothetical protein EZV62_014466 [Acer yangbiense]|uniref:Strictosidine synthase conserved region domain-containing protein n=1 Tax=Acer yangbiense TaxID=1000413 RepID=A0A5C7HS38_9ROSI|nr:hypothetical protein EZV62_014466 [Acer yangbiense]